MSEAPDNASSPSFRHHGLVRVVLAAFGAVQLINGLWALLAPRSFYTEFPFGRGWVELLPAYNEHLMRDVGGLYLATAGLFVGAAVVMRRVTVVIACASWLLFALPHAIYHGFNLDPFPASDAIANAVVLTGTVLVPAWVLAAVARRRATSLARALGEPLRLRAYQGNLRRHSEPSDSRQLQGVAQTVRRGDGADAGLRTSPEGDGRLRRARARLGTVATGLGAP
jgi:hypothetical protein